MTKITFHRKGHANNSSSSHSLIFMSDPSKVSCDGTDGEYGWQFFTLASEEEKKRYAMVALRDSYQSLFRFHTPAANYWDEDFSKVITVRFFKWVKKHLSEFFTQEELDDYQYEETGNGGYHGIGYIDHQSRFTFPCHRDISKGIHEGFASAWLKEFLKPNYIVLGGNDNTSHDHSLLEHDEGADKLLYDMLCERDSQSILCTNDEKTGEFVISQKNHWTGKSSITKVKF